MGLWPNITMMLCEVPTVLAVFEASLVEDTRKIPAAKWKAIPTILVMSPWGLTPGPAQPLLFL